MDWPWSEPTAQWGVWSFANGPRPLDVSMWRSWRKSWGHPLNSASKHAKLPISDICKEKTLGQTFGRTKSRTMVVSSNLATIVVLFSINSQGHDAWVLLFHSNFFFSFFPWFLLGSSFYLVFGFLSLFVVLNSRSSSEVKQQVLLIIT